MGTPSTCTNVTTNATSATSHTHAVTGFLTSVSSGDHSTLSNLSYASAGHTGFSPNTPSFVTLGTTGDLTNERVLTAGTGISLTDGGAGSTITVTNTATGTTVHSSLSNLTYATAGHTGFEPTITTLGETRGGTGESTYTTGDILYSDASNSLAKRGIGSAGQVLTVSGGVPTWANAVSAGGGSGSSVLAGCYPFSSGVGVTAYLCPTGINDNDIWTLTDNNWIVAPYACTIRNLYIYTGSASVGETVTITLMKNSVATTLTAQTNGTGGASDTTNSVSVSAGDKLSLKWTTNGSCGDSYWGMEVVSPGTFYYHNISDATQYDLTTSTKITWITINDYGNFTANSTNSLLLSHRSNFDLKEDFGPDSSKYRILITEVTSGETWAQEGTLSLTTSWASYQLKGLIDTLRDDTTYNVKMQMWMPNTSSSQTYHIRNFTTKIYFNDNGVSV
jgi:hypothetical protein